MLSLKYDVVSLHSPEAEGLSEKMAEDCKRQRDKGGMLHNVSSERRGPQHSGTHSTCDCLPKIYTDLVNILAWRRRRLMSPQS